MVEKSWEAEAQVLHGRVNEVAATLRTHMDAEEKVFLRNEKDHDEFKQKLDRPSWSVTVIITALSSLAVGLMVYVSTHL